MATTALDLITGAMRLIGATDPGEQLTASEASDGLELLNEMLESWSTERLSVYQILQENFTLTAGTGSYTIGSGATFSTTRPIDILGGFIRYSNLDYPLRILTREEYDRIALKTTSYIPEYLFYDPAPLPNGKVYLYGVPDAVYSVFLNSLKQLQSFTAITTAIVLPPGYKRAIRYNLALEIAPEYNRKPPEAVLAIARESKAAIKRLNSRTPKLRLDHIRLTGSAMSDTAAFNAGYP